MKTRKQAWALALSVLMGAGVFTAMPAAVETAQAANSITLFRITTDSTHTVAQLEAQGIDVWQVQPNFVEAPLTPEQIDWLQGSGWDYKMSRQTNGPSFDTSYRTYATVRAALNDYASRYPSLAQVVTIGQTFEGRPIQAIKITNSQSTAGKPKSLWIGGTHAREISPPEVMMSYVDLLLEGYGNDADVTWMLDTREVWIVPVLNADGHLKAEQLINQRKNTNTSWGADGVDLNRNYDEAVPGIWGLYGTSSNPFSIVYPGPRAFSEPETQAIKNLVDSVMGPTGTPQTVANGFNMVVDMHSFGNLVMWPWNWTKDTSVHGAASDIANMERIGTKFAAYNTYKPQLGAKLYATSGDTTDWAYGFHKIPSFTIEIGKTFWPSNQELAGQIAENRGPFLYGNKILDDPYGRVKGPDSNGLTATVQDGRIVITGAANDSYNGNDRVQAVEVFVDTLGARGTGVKGTLGKATSAGSLTDFTATLSTQGLTLGKHLLIVEAQDETGAWGAPSAVFVQIP